MMNICSVLVTLWLCHFTHFKNSRIVKMGLIPILQWKKTEDQEM